MQTVFILFDTLHLCLLHYNQPCLHRWRWAVHYAHLHPHTRPHTIADKYTYTHTRHTHTPRLRHRPNHTPTQTRRYTPAHRHRHRHTHTEADKPTLSYKNTHTVATPFVGGWDSRIKRSSRVVVQRFYYVQLTQKREIMKELRCLPQWGKVRCHRARSVVEVGVGIAPGFSRSVLIWCVRPLPRPPPTRLSPLSAACPVLKTPLPSPLPG